MGKKAVRIFQHTELCHKQIQIIMHRNIAAFSKNNIYRGNGQ